ncbi:MAG: twin-arginine translocase subunit TatC [Alphaproteobacteria bacterium]|nr:twin-arginine translocase subunit TatC [Alphaproteobacteria bacterium]
MSEKEQTLLEHLEELRHRFLIALVVFVLSFIACYFFVADIYGFLVAPLAEIMHGQGSSTNRMIYTKLTEGFITTIRTAVFGSFMVTVPFVLLQLWRYISPGLFRSERKELLPYFMATPVLFFMGASFAYYVMIPFAWKFLLGFQGQNIAGDMPVQLEASISEYLSIVTSLIIVFGVCFQLPVIISLLVRAGLVSVDMLRKFRKYAIVIAFLFSAIVTPPDVVSQIGLAVPLLLLYELSIFWNRGRERASVSSDATS